MDNAPRTLAALLSDPPLLHDDPAGGTTSWQLSDEALRFVDAHIQAGSRTLETGEGLSTVLFALRGAEHICVTPNTGVVERIRRFCSESGIGLGQVTFKIGFSQDVLPRLDPAPLDLVLIDGGHGFPIPFVDWLYTAGRLRVGGLLIVDDTHIWTGDALKRFIGAEPEWQLVSDLGARSSAFRKVAEIDRPKEWNDQPFVVRASEHGDWGGKLRRGMAMLRRGDFRTFRDRMSEYVTRRP